MNVIDYKWSKNGRTAVFLISSEAYEYAEKETKLDAFVWNRDLGNYYVATDNVYYLDRPMGYSKSFPEIVIEEIAKLTRLGFTLTNYAQKNYEFWGKKYAEIIANKEEEKRLRREREEQRKREAEEKLKTLSNYTYIDWCPKYDCRTNYESCQHCSRSVFGCRPTKVKAVCR